METHNPEPQDNSVTLTVSDLRAAGEEGVITTEDAARLITWAYSRAASRDLAEAEIPEDKKGLNLVTVAYYFGAMLMISASAWFLGDKWDVLGSAGVLTTSLIYFLTTLSVGLWLRVKGYTVGGGLLVTVAVCLVPLITFTIEDLLGFWPTQPPGEYQDFYPTIRGSWIVMELATIVAGLVALKFVRFGFLTAPIAFSFWFLSMDVAALMLGDNTLEWNTRAWIGVVVGLIIIGIGYGLDRTLHQPGEPRSEDFAYWCYLFGLMTFWGNLTSIDGNSELSRAVYALINLGLVGAALKLRRPVFLVFGALGIHVYLGYLAYRVFQDSVMFPFVLAGLGLSLILVTIAAQRYMKNKKLGRAGQRV